MEYQQLIKLHLKHGLRALCVLGCIFVEVLLQCIVARILVLGKVVLSTNIPYRAYITSEWEREHTDLVMAPSTQKLVASCLNRSLGLTDIIWLLCSELALLSLLDFDFAAFLALLSCHL